MLIHAERAFWILEFYRRSKVKLAFGGKILGEEAACHAVISGVRNDNHTIAIKLLSDEEKQVWERLVDLRDAQFSLIQFGDPEFLQFPKGLFHSVLIIGFPDGTLMFIAEQIAAT